MDRNKKASLLEFYSFEVQYLIIVNLIKLITAVLGEMNFKNVQMCTNTQIITAGMKIKLKLNS